MKISLLTDAPKHNLALMKIAQWHVKNGDYVDLNLPVFPSDYRYASLLFERSRHLFQADEYGGPAINGSVLNTEFESMKPYYDLYPHNDYSLGYTYRPCSNTCHFCKVPTMNHPDIDHHSIWEFHDSRFKKICILNNNTFQDPKFRDTFIEIWEADLTVIDENGYDIRLIDYEKALILKNTKFQGKIHFAWDRVQDEALVINGMEAIKKSKLQNVRFYVLIGYDTDLEQDLYRCQKIIDFGYDPYIMPFKKTKQNMRFKRFIDTFMWRKYKTIKEAWENYKKNLPIKNINKQAKLLF